MDGFIIEHRPNHVGACEQPPPIGEYLEWRQLEVAEQLLDDGLGGEEEAGHKHLLVEENIPGPKFQEDVIIRSGKVKVYGRRKVVIMAEVNLVY
jgi:hypothetical protein